MSPARRLLLQGAAAVLLPAAGVLAHVADDDGRDPVRSLQQLDLLYLDEPAPGLVPTGTPVVLVFCDGCELPDVARATVDVRDDRALARRYGLGAPGLSGYALVDGDGRVRYRTYDPHLGDHGIEIQTLVDGMVRG